MQKSKSDPSVFYRNSYSGIIQLVVFVDDVVIIGSDSKGISSLKSFLQSQFHAKDLGNTSWALKLCESNMKSSYLKGNMCLIDLLSETGKLGVKPCSSPMVSGVHLTKEGETFGDLERYRRLIGKLNYLTTTGPDITHSVSVVCQYMSSPTIDHWVAVEQILCYLKGAPRRGIVYSNNEHNRLECFTNTD